jgi:competence protein CoiA
MPLKCINGEREIYSFDVKTDDAWESLRKENAKTKALRMQCCGAGVVLRTSKLGTRHFAHARRGPCVTAPETAEHLLAKMAVVEGVKATAWAALPEQSGQTPSGAEWRADVLAVKGKARVAFEIQWSRQDSDETDRRQQRYTDAGVRGLWLFRQKDFPTRKEIPSFRLVFHEDTQTFEVLMPSPHYDPMWAARDTDDSRSWGQRIPLTRFVSGALEGRLHFAPALGLRMPVDVEAVQIRCWRCKKETGVVMGLVFAASRVLAGCPDIPASIYDIGEGLPDGAAEVMSILTSALLKQHGIGVVKPRWSKTEGREYISNGCLHCDALQGRFFEHEYAFEAAKAFETEAVFKAEWMPRLGELRPYVYRWWFDES